MSSALMPFSVWRAWNASNWSGRMQCRTLGILREGDFEGVIGIEKVFKGESNTCTDPLTS